MDKEINRLKNLNLPEEVKTRIIEFIDETRLVDLSLNRQ